MVNNIEAVGSLKTARLSPARRKIHSPEIIEGRYFVKIAATPAEVESALRLRHEVFNLELGASAAQNTGNLEYDEYDAACRHLIVIDRATRRTIGTYRLNFNESARRAEGFYAYNEFSLEDLPAEVLRQSVEVGRACVAREHRGSKVFYLLWKSLLAYLSDARKRYFFGCCSLFTQDCAAAAAVFQNFERQGFVHPQIKIRPRRNRAFNVSEISPEAGQIELPGLFNLYLKIGVKICGAPAIDREFGTIDFFVLFDLYEMSDKYQRMFACPVPPASETNQIRRIL